jgi:uncharacterized protein YjiS (DUF1127 family)
MYVAPSHDMDFARARTGGWLSGIGGMARRRYSVWAARRRELATARALYHLSDAELRDMGLSRGEIPAVVSGTYCRD